MKDCPECWGTGFIRGFGGPCQKGCKPEPKEIEFTHNGNLISVEPPIYHWQQIEEHIRDHECPCFDNIRNHD